MPDIPGLPRAHQRVLFAVLTIITRLPGLDSDLLRRALWLKWKLEGFDPAAQNFAAVALRQAG